MTRILVVEDDPSLAAMLVDYFETLGYRASIAPNGAHALQYVDLRKPDAIVLDLMLPVITGVEVAQRLRQSPDTSDIPILAITAVEGPTEFAEVLMVDAVIAKPFDLDTVGSKIEALLNNQSRSTTEEHVAPEPGVAPSKW